MNNNTYDIFFDGASRGNPGPSGAGAIVIHNGKPYLILSKYIGITTNNVAEYTALKEILLKLEPIIKDKKDIGLIIKCDSELVSKQLTGVYKIKNERLKYLAKGILKTLKRYGNWSITHIPREMNQIADSLATSAIKNALIALKTK
ncbi:MAG: hypothetical protein B5M53_00110 [Candidatus Cloacimonas sp. 4484_209]|nr:MAG: hypothetical protein B5M53_00110 [Candidatus Cloacimonas sp. 4484_209]